MLVEDAGVVVDACPSQLFHFFWCEVSIEIGHLGGGCNLVDAAADVLAEGDVVSSFCQSELVDEFDGKLRDECVALGRAVRLHFEDEAYARASGCCLQILLQGRDELSVGEPVVHERGEGGVFYADAVDGGIVKDDGHSVGREPDVELTAPAAGFGSTLE